MAENLGSIYSEQLTGEMKDLLEKELKLFEKKFKEDVYGDIGGAEIMMTARDKWMINMLAVISARSIFIGDWYSTLQEKLDTLNK